MKITLSKNESGSVLELSVFEDDEEESKVFLNNLYRTLCALKEEGISPNILLEAPFIIHRKLLKGVMETQKARDAKTYTSFEDVVSSLLKDEIYEKAKSDAELSAYLMELDHVFMGRPE